MLVMAEDAATIRAKKKKERKKEDSKKRRRRRRRDPTIIGERELGTIKGEEEEGKGKEGGETDGKRSKRRWKNAVGEQENSFEAATLGRREVFPQSARTYV